jgi:hypothetical protein
LGDCYQPLAHLSPFGPTPLSVTTLGRLCANIGMTT